jgi:hypothetical protein
MNASENGELANYFKIRTITAFISESIDHEDPELLSSQIEDTAKFLRDAKSVYESKGKSYFTRSIG